MKQKTTGIFVALGIIAILGISFVAAHPGFGGKATFGNDLSDEELAEIKAFRENVKAAIETDNYEAWKKLMESQLTEENFNKAVERHETVSEHRELISSLHEAIESGDEETANELKEELRNSGFGHPHKFKSGFFR